MPGGSAALSACPLCRCWSKCDAKIVIIVCRNPHFATTGRFGTALEAGDVRHAIANTATSRAASWSSAANSSGRFAADLLQNVERVARGDTDRPGFIEENH